MEMDAMVGAVVTKAVVDERAAMDAISSVNLVILVVCSGWKGLCCCLRLSYLKNYEMMEVVHWGVLILAGNIQ